MQLARASEMQQLDRMAIEDYGIPGIVLMENAGRGTVEYMRKELGPVKGKHILIFIGPGNNGGDGLVIARMLNQLGGLPTIISLVEPDTLKGDAALNYNSVREIGIPSSKMLDENALHSLSAESILPGSTKPIWAIVDAIFGTGLQRPLSDHFLAAVQCINRLRKSSSCPVVAVDIPSGMNADTGTILGAGVEADHTVTYGLAKPGHFIQGGHLCGRLHIVDIGIPSAALNKQKLTGQLVGPEILGVFDERSLPSHKGNFGHLLILAGSAGKSGAAFLTGLGALRAGTGLVTMAIPADLRTVFESNLFEAMTLLLPDSRRYASIKDHPILMENIQGKTALAVGPGISTTSRTQKLILKLYTECELPMVMDADALNILAMDPTCIPDPPAPRILTPHPGEMARLTGSNTQDIQADRLNAVCNFTTSVNKKRKNITTVLKGAGTVICDPDGIWSINSSGNPGMATGGMGDILTGVIGGFLAQRMEPCIAAKSGVFVHGSAADILAAERKCGYLASEVADQVPYILTDFNKVYNERVLC